MQTLYYFATHVLELHKIFQIDCLLCYSNSIELETLQTYTKLSKEVIRIRLSILLKDKIFIEYKNKNLPSYKLANIKEGMDFMRIISETYIDPFLYCRKKTAEIFFLAKRFLQLKA